MPAAPHPLGTPWPQSSSADLQPGSDGAGPSSSSCPQRDLRSNAPSRDPARPTRDHQNICYKHITCILMGVALDSKDFPPRLFLPLLHQCTLT